MSDRGAPRKLPEWIGSNPDAAIPPRVQRRIHDRYGGRCAHCTRKVGPGHEPRAFDHVRALINGGEHREGNLQLLCQECHAAKSRTDVAEKSRSYRKRAAHLGIKRKSRGFRGWRKFSGEIVYADERGKR